MKLTNETILRVLEIYGYMTGAPKTAENIRGYLALVSMNCKTEEDYKKAFNNHIKNNQTFPGHIDIKNILKPSLKKLTAAEIFGDDVENPEAVAIRKILQRDYLSHIPEPATYEMRMATVKDAQQWKLDINIAIARFYKIADEKYNISEIMNGVPAIGYQDSNLIGVENDN